MKRCLRLSVGLWSVCLGDACYLFAVVLIHKFLHVLYCILFLNCVLGHTQGRLLAPFRFRTSHHCLKCLPLVRVGEREKHKSLSFSLVHHLKRCWKSRQRELKWRQTDRASKVLGNMRQIRKPEKPTRSRQKQISLDKEEDRRRRSQRNVITATPIVLKLILKLVVWCVVKTLVKSGFSVTKLRMGTHWVCRCEWSTVLLLWQLCVTDTELLSVEQSLNFCS